MMRFTDAISRRRLSYLLFESNLSQREFARQAGISNAVLSEALAGHHLLSNSNAQKVAAYCKVSPDWIQGGMCNRQGEIFDNAGEIADLFCEADEDTQFRVLRLLGISPSDPDCQPCSFPESAENITNDNKNKLPGELSEGALKDKLNEIQKQIDDLKRIIAN